MPKIKGTIVYAERRASRTGGKYWRVGVKSADGQVYWVNARSFTGRVGGQGIVEISAEELRRVTQPQEHRLEEAPGEPQRDTRIAREVALKCAVEYAASRPSENWQPQGILELADTFFDWIIGPSFASAVSEPEEPEEVTEEEDVIQL